MSGRRDLAICVALGCLLGAANAAGQGRCPDYAPQKNVYFGDLHTHTSYSFDALDYGTRTDPARAYAFARGAAVDVANGASPTAGQTPGPSGVTIAASGGALDFLAVTDHAEFLGTVHGCTVDAGSGFTADPYCVALRGTPNPEFLDPTAPNFVVSSPCLGTLPNGTKATPEECVRQTRSAWDAGRQATSAAYAPCAFTTFHAFEWSGVDLDERPFPTLHRNVFFANDTVPPLPFDFVGFSDVRRLWAALEAECREADGCSAITIPHNSNQSRGKMFDTTGWAAADLDRMARYQRLVELHQHKGNSECLTDTADTGAVVACDFELETGDTEPVSTPGYVRPALERGLVRWAAERSNPLQLGFVGATDTHNATPGAVGEQTWPGHSGLNDNTPLKRLTDIGGQNPGGLTGVWAEENTREAIFAALVRREAFATSGPRIAVRFYAVSGDGDPCADPQFPAGVIAAGGVPMGGTLREPGAPPRFVVYALPDATPLAAVDLVRATVVDGEPVERVTDIPLSGPPYCVTWTDAEFRPGSPAFWYVRVKEQPTPRWSHHDCERLRLSNPVDWQALAPGCASRDPAAGGLDVTVQERAWTSPIWYLPGQLVPVATATLHVRDHGRRRFRYDATSGPDAPRRIVPPARRSAGDPTRTGASLTVYNSAGSGETTTVSLRAAGWRGNRRGTRYTFHGGAGGPIRKVTLARDRIAVRGGRRGLGYTLDEPAQGRIAVRLAVGGGDLWCAEAPARTDVPGRFEAEPGTPAPVLCPMLGAR